MDTNLNTTGAGQLTVGYSRLDRREAFVPLADMMSGGRQISIGDDLFPPKSFLVRGLNPVVGKYKRFMPVAQAYANMSKYPGVKVGALILGPGFEDRASGWNGAPRGSAADADGRLADRKTRLAWAVHAEANAITNAARSGTSTVGCTMVTTHLPCMNCAKLIVQAGIVRVLTHKPDGVFAERWADEFEMTRSLFRECGVALFEFDIEESKE